MPFRALIDACWKEKYTASRFTRDLIAGITVGIIAIPLTPEIKALEKVRTLTLSGMLAEAIRRISNEESISAMFEH